MNYLQLAQNDKYHKLPTAFAKLFCEADDDLKELIDTLKATRNRIKGAGLTTCEIDLVLSKYKADKKRT